MTRAEADASLAGRQALVTGAGQGVGRAVALALGGTGAHVLVNDVVAERAQAVADEVRGADGSAEPLAFDVTDYAATVAAVERSGPVHVLVNNAGNGGADGFGRLAPFHETAPEEWEPYLQVNLYGVLHCTRAVLPAMTSGGWGRVITVVSDAGRVGDKGVAAYSAAKAGAAGLMRAVAAELGRYGVTANCIALGTMRTPLTETLWASEDDPASREVLRSYVVRRPGLPADVAPLVVLLASESGSWITGQTYPVNGGRSFAL